VAPSDVEARWFLVTDGLLMGEGVNPLASRATREHNTKNAKFANLKIFVMVPFLQKEGLVSLDMIAAPCPGFRRRQQVDIL